MEGKPPQEQQPTSLERRLDASPSVNPENEQQHAREKMGALIDKLEGSVNEKGVVAVVLGDKNESGDHRAGILVEPVLKPDADRGGLSAAGFIALTPDGAMAIDIRDNYSNGRAVFDLMRQQTPEDYISSREAYLKKIKYIAESLPGVTPRSMSYRLENPGRTTIYMQPVEQSKLSGTNVEDIFDKSVAKATKPLEGFKNQAIEATRLADSLSAKI